MHEGVADASARLGQSHSKEPGTYLGYAASSISVFCIAGQQLAGMSHTCNVVGIPNCFQYQQY